MGARVMRPLVSIAVQGFRDRQSFHFGVIHHDLTGMFITVKDEVAGVEAVHR